MNILCLFQRFSFQSSTIYLDLVKELVRKGHHVYVLAGTTDAVSEKIIYEEEGCKVAYVRLPDQFHAGKIKKGLVQLFLEPKMISVMKRHFFCESIDLILYPTPPITLAGVVACAKKHFHAKSYLMLKDIFPQNAVDLGMMRENGLLHVYFKYVEKRLYRISDVIGCMSDANISYMKQHFGSLVGGKLELFPNTVKILPTAQRKPTEDKVVHFVFGGNLGKPQAVDFLLSGILACRENSQAFFSIIGDGTESRKVEQFFKEHHLSNASYQKQLPREQYEEWLTTQDVGLVMLSSKFTIPNFPSRVLSYMQMEMPVLAVTDRNSDIGHMITKDAKCGFYAPSDDLNQFVSSIHNICEQKNELREMGQRGKNYLLEHYNVERSVDILLRHFQ